MKKKRPDDIRFLINTFAITLVIVGVIIAFQPYLEYEPRLEEVKHIESKIVTLEPQQVADMVTNDKKPVMLVGYASWCYYCRQVMPTLVEMVRSHELDSVTPVFISLDDQPRKLSQYLVYHDYNTAFSPYVVDRGLFRRISSAMRATGSGFTGVIPYIGFFGRDGKLKAEVTGVVGKDKIIAMAQTVK